VTMVDDPCGASIDMCAVVVTHCGGLGEETGDVMHQSVTCWGQLGSSLRSLGMLAGAGGRGSVVAQALAAHG
jgi:hypothetical protein